MSNIVFDEEMGRIQRAIAESHDLVVRRIFLWTRSTYEPAKRC
jgi:hypothetical protein